jgi:hypothetical protein
MEKNAQKETTMNLAEKTVILVVIWCSFLLCLPIMALGTDSDKQSAPETEFNLFYTANVLGELEACG